MQSLLVEDLAAALVAERHRRAEGARLRRAIRRLGTNSHIGPVVDKDLGRSLGARC